MIRRHFLKSGAFGGLMAAAPGAIDGSSKDEIGMRYPSEIRVYTDKKSGVQVKQLTDYKGHSHHFYFTNPGWFDNGNRLLIGSDRCNRANLFAVDLQGGEIEQFTDLKPVPLPREVEFLRACINQAQTEVYYMHEFKLIGQDLKTLKSRVIYELPHDYDVSMLNCTADDKYICLSINEDLSDQFEVDLLRGYVGFKEYWEAQPLSRILRVAVNGSGMETLFEEHYWIGHVNTSPTQPHLLTFCHEGPWDKVDNRIWGLDMDSGEVWKIRPPGNKGEVVGHEYWYADGIHIGFHGHYPDGRSYIGRIRYDNSNRVESAFDKHPGHIHSNDEHMIVGDGGGIIRIWRWDGNTYEGPRLLCEHRSTMKVQQLHPHPRFNQSGTEVVFTSDMSGYGNVYLTQVPDFESLPLVEDEK